MTMRHVETAILNSTQIQSATRSIEKLDDGNAMDVAREFEKMLLGNLVGEMMQTVKVGVFSNQKNASMWGSFLSDAVAEKLVANGGIGLQQSVYDILVAYGKAERSVSTRAGEGGSN